MLPDEMPQRGDDDSEECENMTEVLDVRKMRILQAIVDDYILTASAQELCQSVTISSFHPQRFATR